MQQGVIPASESSWASVLDMVPMAKVGEGRSCGDYRALNSDTEPGSYPVPRIHYCVAAIHGKTIFSNIDLVRAYHRIPVAPQDVPKIAITTPFELFEFARLHFGSCNAAQTVQWFINSVLRGLYFVFVYIGDLFVTSTDENKHLRHLDLFFQ